MPPERARSRHRHPVRRHRRLRIEGKAAAARAGQLGGHLPAPVLDPCLCIQRAEHEIALCDALCPQCALDVRSPFGEKRINTAIGGADRKPAGGGKTGIVCAERPLHALPLRQADEAQIAIHTAAADRQLAGQPAIFRAQLPTRQRPADAQILDIEGGAAIFGQQNSAIAGERPEHRSTLGRIGETGRRRIEHQAHVGKAGRVERIVEIEHQPGPLQLADQRHVEPAPALMFAHAADIEGAVPIAQAAAGKAQQRRGDGEVRETEQAILAPHQTGAQTRLAARQMAQERVVEPGGHGVDIPADHQLAAYAGRHVDIRADIDQAQTLQRKIIGAAGDVDQEIAPVQRHIDIGAAAEAARADRQPLTAHTAACHPQTPLGRQIGKQLLAERAQPVEQTGLQADGQDADTVDQPPIAGGAHARQLGLADLQAVGGHPVIEAQPLWRPVEARQDAQIARA